MTGISWLTWPEHSNPSSSLRISTFYDPKYNHGESSSRKSKGQAVIRMARHRGKFDPKSEEPYELSRSRIENFGRCPACFYMQQVEKIEFPSIPGFLLNEATDVLLKKYFDYFRAKQITPPFLKKRKLGHLVPFQHEEFELWTQSLHFGAPGRMHTVVDEYNLKIGGGVDDIWQDKNNGVLDVVDYKSTSKKTDGLALLDGFLPKP